MKPGLIITLFVVLGFLCYDSFAQLQKQFINLNNAVKLNNRDSVAIYYTGICNEIVAGEIKSDDFQKFTEASHLISRLGYANVVINKLENIAGSEDFFGKISPEYYGVFFNEQ